MSETIGKFVVGDLVQLLTGGPNMTVEFMREECPDVSGVEHDLSRIFCVWFDTENALHRADFHVDLLRRVQDGIVVK